MGAGHAAENQGTDKAMTLRHITALLLAPLAALHAADSSALGDHRATLPKAVELPVLDGAEFRVITSYEFAKDGYRFLHGVALAWHKGTLYASFAHNKGGENTDTEEARVCVIADGGKTWSEVTTIDSGDEPGIGVSRGVFLSHKGRLWAFHGAYTGTMQKVHTRAYLLDETTGKWERKGAVVEGGFWALGEPQRMNDGNWIMAGFRAGAGTPASISWPWSSMPWPTSAVGRPTAPTSAFGSKQERSITAPSPTNLLETHVVLG
jgi:hypothetical protein